MDALVKDKYYSQAVRDIRSKQLKEQILTGLELVNMARNENTEQLTERINANQEH